MHTKALCQVTVVLLALVQLLHALGTHQVENGFKMYCTVFGLNALQSEIMIDVYPNDHSSLSFNYIYELLLQITEQVASSSVSFTCGINLRGSVMISLLTIACT